MAKPAYALDCLVEESREELAHGQEQARKREYDEHDLVDVIFSGRQSACEVRRPEHRVIP